MSPGETASDLARATATGPDTGFWRGRRVLLTGHTGFKGAWLALWLQALGAELTGFSRGAPTEPSLFELARVREGMESIAGDIRDPVAVGEAVARSAAEVVIHLAAQPLVRRSYERPRETFETNVMGTINVLETARRRGGPRVLLCVTSDKCYENAGERQAGAANGPWLGFDEDAPLGGADPYSSSKAAAELAVCAYRRSFFADGRAARVASARAGNVIGGGDWGEDRLLPDLMRAACSGELALVRNPRAVRPWQHVLCPLSGYLALIEALWASPEHTGAWNFGPGEEDARPVGWVVERLSELWPGGLRWARDGGPDGPGPVAARGEIAAGRREQGLGAGGSPEDRSGAGARCAHEPARHEAAYLKIDSSRVRERLGWRPALDLEGALEATVEWYLALQRGADMRAVTGAQLALVAPDHPGRLTGAGAPDGRVGRA